MADNSTVETLTSAEMLRKVAKETAAELGAMERVPAELKMAAPDWMKLFCKNWPVVLAVLSGFGQSSNWLVKLAVRLLIDVGDELAKKCPDHAS